MVITSENSPSPSHTKSNVSSRDATLNTPTKITYPPLFYRADQYALKEQRSYYVGLFLQLFFSFLVTVFSIYYRESSSHAVLQTIFLLLLFVLSVYLFFSKKVDRWYAARACAESVKTRSWRFMMKADPYRNSNEDALSLFTQDLDASLLDQKPFLSALSADPPNEQSIDLCFASLCEIRAWDTPRRSEFYHQERIRNQHNWYCAKSRKKGIQGTVFSLLFLVFVLVALAVSISRIFIPSNPVWPIDAVVCIAMAILTWIQAKKFSELKSTYQQAGQETKRMLDAWPQTPIERELACLVAETENTFSSEHTQWVSRKAS